MPTKSGKKVAPKNRGGRPPSEASKISIGLALLDAGEKERAVEESGLSLATLYRAKASRVASPSSAAPAVAPPFSPPPGATIRVAGHRQVTQAPPQGGQVAPPDLLVLVRRILAARNPAALAELDAGLLEATKGEPDLAAWLARPLPHSAEDADPLDAALAALAVAVAHAEVLSPLHPRAATVLGVVSQLSARVESIAKGRPQQISKGEVVERLEAARDEALKRILPRLAASQAQLGARRQALDAWAAQNLGPLAVAELGRHVDAMLGTAAA